jgi:N-acetyl-alpha-D-glucosaminyl L-malate synthase BshA
MATYKDSQRIRIGFVLHVMQVAGAEMLVAETIRSLRDLIDPTIFCLDGVGTLGESLQREHVPVVPLGRRPGLDFAVARRMAREIRARGCEVVHAHQYTPFVYAALAKLQVWPRFKLIFTEHGRHYPDVVSQKRYWANRILFSRLADEVNAVCQFSARSLKEVEGFRVPIDVIQNGIRLNNYAPNHTLETSLDIDPRTRHIVCIARFHPVKDHSTLLRAFSEIARLRSDVELLLVGDGSLRNDLEHQADSLGVSNRVRFLGIRNDVPSILRAADVFVLPSISEAASLTLLEAMASAVPVVVTDVGGNREIVRQGVDGLLVPRGDAGAMAHACLDLLADPKRAKVIGMSGRGRVEQSFRLENTIGEYYRRYQNVARRRER